MKNELGDFLNRVWGKESGVRFISTEVPGKGKSWKDTPFGSTDEAVAFAASAIDKGLHVYFAPNLFGPGTDTRRKVNAAGSRAFYVDIDCGKGKAYGTKEEALTAVIKTVNDTGLPEPSEAIDSGNGLHLYWFLRESISVDVWSDTAKRLQDLLIQRGSKVDESVTKDCARAMRLPGSFNRKDPADGDGKPCEILNLQNDPIDPAELQAILTKPPAAIANGSE